MRHRFNDCFLLAGITLLVIHDYATSAEPRAVQRPDHLSIVKKYAGAMIADGRDTYGEKHSPLFAAALDRKTMTIGSFPGIKGVRSKDRSLKGANPQEDMDLYHILYKLTEITGEPAYAEEADEALEYFFENCQSSKTGLMAWGEHIFWNLESDRMGPRRDKYHEINGEWPYWDECYRLAPEASWKFALGLWDHQVYDKKTGDFSRHALWTEHGPQGGAEFPRYAGQMILNWADAYARPENADRERRQELLTAIETILRRMEANMKRTKTGYLPACTTFSSNVCWPASNLELARCLCGAMPLVPRTLARRMERIALLQDNHFHQMPHTITEPEGAIVTEVLVETGEPHVKTRYARPYSKAWTAGYGLATHADMANACYQRYSQLKSRHPDLAEKYSVLLLAAADAYLSTEPDRNDFLRPDGLCPTIELLLHAHEITRDNRYLERARHFADLGIALFLDETSALPKASNKHDHYESITGGPRFMRALLDLHLVVRN